MKIQARFASIPKTFLESVGIAGLATGLSFALANLCQAALDSRLCPSCAVIAGYAPGNVGTREYVPLAIAIYLGSTAIRSRHWFASLLIGLAALGVWLPVISGVTLLRTIEGDRMDNALYHLEESLLISALLLNALLIVLYCGYRKMRRGREPAMTAPPTRSAQPDNISPLSAFNRLSPPQTDPNIGLSRG